MYYFIIIIRKLKRFGSYYKSNSFFRNFEFVQSLENHINIYIIRGLNTNDLKTK